MLYHAIFSKDFYDFFRQAGRDHGHDRRGTAVTFGTT
jgi:hypothetical protein